MTLEIIKLNSALSASRRMSFVESGVAQTGTPNVITLGAGASSVADYYKGKRVRIVSGIGAGQDRLIVASRYNLVGHSGELDNAYFGKSNLQPITPDTIASPFGDLVAEKIIPNTVYAGHQHETYGKYSIPAGVKYTTYVFAKALELGRFRFWNANTGAGAKFNLFTATVESLFGVSAASITPMTNGWFLCTSTYTQPTSPQIAQRMYLLDPLNGGDVWTGDGVSGLSLWGIQCREGDADQYYIPTIAGAASGAVVDSPWIVTPDQTSVYEIYNGSMALIDSSKITLKSSMSSGITQRLTRPSSVSRSIRLNSAIDVEVL